MNDNKKAKLPSFNWQSPVGIASFVHLEEPDTEGQYADGKFKLDVLFKKDDPKIAEFDTKVTQLATQYFTKTVGLFLPVKDGNEKDVTKYAIYQDKFYLTLKTARRPALLGPDNLPIEASKFYSGCFVRVLATVSCFKTGATKGVTMYLNAVQFIADGQRLDQGSGVKEVRFTDDAADVASALSSFS